MKKSYKYTLNNIPLDLKTIASILNMKYITLYQRVIRQNDKIYSERINGYIFIAEVVNNKLIKKTQ